MQYDANGVAIICSSKQKACDELAKLNLGELNNLVHSRGVTCNVKKVWQSAAASKPNNVEMALALALLAGLAVA